MPLAHGRSYSYAENSGDAPREDTMITRSLQAWRFGARRNTKLNINLAKAHHEIRLY